MQQLDHKKNVSTKYEILNDKYKNINHTKANSKRLRVLQPGSLKKFNHHIARITHNKIQINQSELQTKAGKGD